MNKRSIALQKSNAGLVSRSFAVLAKDIRLEFRSRYAINAILMFGITSLAVVSFSVGQSSLPPVLMAAVFWIVMFFSAVSGLAQVFIREEEAGTSLVLKLNGPAEPVYLGKLFFNFLLLSTMSMIITPLFFMFTDAPTDGVVAFLAILLLGVIGLCAATTLVAAVIAKAAIKGALFAVLSFPILVPLLLPVVNATEIVFDGGAFIDISAHLQFLLAYAVIMIVGSLLLFRFVWEE